jgi:hypothetical protein
MKTTNKNYQNKRTFLNPTGYTIKGEYVTVFLGEQIAMRVHKNYFNKILGNEFVSVSKIKEKQEVA